MKINDLLNEAYTDIPEDKFEKLLSTKFSQAWQHYINTGNGIFRHDESASGYDPELVVKFATPLKDREAAYAHSNLHNEYINNDSQWSAFPKRAVIGGSHVDIARRRGSSSGVYLILPVNNTPIGLCPQHDIWASFENVQKIMGAQPDMQVLGNFYRHELFMFTEAIEYILDFKFHSWIKDSGGSYDSYRDELSNFDALLDNVKSEDYEEVVEYYDISQDRELDDVEIVRCIFGYDYNDGAIPKRLHNFCLSVRKNGLTRTMDWLFSPKNFQVGNIEDVITDENDDNEVWFNSSYLMIPYVHLKDYYYKYKDI